MRAERDECSKNKDLHLLALCICVIVNVCTGYLYASFECQIFAKSCQSATMMLLLTPLRSLHLSSADGRFSSVSQARSEILLSFL